MSTSKGPLLPPDDDVEFHPYDPAEEVGNWVFVSHTSVDAPFVQAEIVPLAMTEQLVLHFVNKDSGPVVSQPYKRQILRSLARCASFMVVVSKSSLASPWVRFEVGWAAQYRTRNRSLVVLLDNSQLCEISDWLGEIKMIDYYKSDVTARSELRQRLQSWNTGL